MKSSTTASTPSCMNLVLATLSLLTTCCSTCRAILLRRDGEREASPSADDDCTLIMFMHADRMASDDCACFSRRTNALSAARSGEERGGSASEDGEVASECWVMEHKRLDARSFVVSTSCESNFCWECEDAMQVTNAQGQGQGGTNAKNGGNSNWGFSTDRCKFDLEMLVLLQRLC